MTPETMLSGPESDAETGPVLTVDLTPADCQALLQALARSISDLTDETPVAPYLLDEEIAEDLARAWALIERLSIPVRDWPERNLPV